MPKVGEKLSGRWQCVSLGLSFARFSFDGVIPSEAAFQCGAGILPFRQAQGKL
jgi:hypothetical protein